MRMNGNVRIGVLNAQNQVVPAANATSNRVYSLTTREHRQRVPAGRAGNVPSTPTGLAASAGNAQVALTWNAVSGATGYNVKRSTTNGGPYANVAAERRPATSYTNTGLTNGTPYYYVVTALNASGESPVSLQVSATPAATGGDTGGVTVTKAVTSAQPLVQRDPGAPRATPSPITAMTVTVVVQRTPGVSYSGAYNTVGGQITQANASTASTRDVHLDAERRTAAGRVDISARSRRSSAAPALRIRSPATRGR